MLLLLPLSLVGADTKFGHIAQCGQRLAERLLEAQETAFEHQGDKPSATKHKLAEPDVLPRVRPTG